MSRSNGSRVRWRSSKAPPSDSCGGFTLLEVVVAFACVALILGAVLRVFSLGVRSTDSAEKRTMGTMLAQSVLTQIETAEPLSPREASGAFENGYRWWYRIEPYEEDGIEDAQDELGTARAYTVAVGVTWGQEDDPSGTVTLRTLRVGVDAEEAFELDQAPQ